MTRSFALLLCTAVVLLGVPAVAHAQKQIVPPLHTSGYQVLDAAGHPVWLTSVNWYGFDQKEFVVGGLDHAPYTDHPLDQSHRGARATALGERDG